MELSTLLQEAEQILKQGGRHAPLLLLAFDGLPLPVRLSFELPATSDARQHHLFLRGKQVAASYHDWRLKRVWFLHEAWLNFPDPARPHVAPSQDPLRRDVLDVLQLDPTSLELELQMVIREIKRKKGKVKALEPLAELEGVQEQTVPVTALALSFLLGFAEASNQRYKQLHTKILVHRSIIEGIESGWFRNF